MFLYHIICSLSSYKNVCKLSYLMETNVLLSTERSVIFYRKLCECSLILVIHFKSRTNFSVTVQFRYVLFSFPKRCATIRLTHNVSGHSVTHAVQSAYKERHTDFTFELNVTRRTGRNSWPEDEDDALRNHIGASVKEVVFVLKNYETL